MITSYINNTSASTGCLGHSGDAVVKVVFLH